MGYVRQLLLTNTIAIFWDAIGHQCMRSRWKTQCPIIGLPQVFGRTSVWWGIRSHPVIIGTRPLSRVYITLPTSLWPGIRKHHETLWVADLPTLRGWHYNEITNISVYCLVLVCWSTFSEHVYSEHNAHEKAMIPPVDSSGKLWPCWRGLKVEGSTKWHKFIIFPLISTRMGQIMSTNTPLRRDCFYINCQRWNLEFQGITMYYTTCHPCPQTTTAWHLPIAPLWHGSHGSCRTCREDPAWLRKLAQILPCYLGETLRDCGQPRLLVGGLALGALAGGAWGWWGTGAT